MKIENLIKFFTTYSEKIIEIGKNDLEKKYILENIKNTIETLEINTPQKPIMDKYKMHYLCPCCKKFVGNDVYQDNICNNCKKRIDWDIEK